MKSLKKIALFVTCLTSLSSYAQNQNYVPQSGDVGLGTTTPHAKLDVQGSSLLSGKVTIDSTTYIKDSLIVKKDLIVEQDVKIMGRHTVTGVLKTKDNLKVMGTANLKGNTNIDGNLKVQSLADPNTNELRYAVLKPNGQLEVKSATELIDAIYDQRTCSPNQVLPTWQNDTSILFVACPVDAKVGIGTNDPKFKLSVNGDSYASSAQFGTSADTISSWFGTTLYSNSVNHTNTVVRASFQSDYGRGIIIQVDNPTTKALVVRNEVADSLGRETIRLNANGRIDARSFLIATNIWADYVFEDDYVLMPLTKVEEYIEANGHLPNVPTAEEVAEDGYKMEQMDATQMEKIEELTLYLIDLDKQVKQMHSEIERLKADNSRLLQEQTQN